MLAQITIGNWIAILGITVPILLAFLAVTWKWHEKQDIKLASTCVRATVLETKVDDHARGLEKGDAKFEGIAAQIGSLREETAGMKATVESVRQTQSAMDAKLDDLLARGGGS